MHRPCASRASSCVALTACGGSTSRAADRGTGDHARARERPRLDRQRRAARGRSDRDRRRPHRRRRHDRRHSRARRHGGDDRPRRTVRRPRLHRLARPLPRRRVPPVVGAAARRADARGVRRADQGVRRDRAGRHVDHRRRLGSHAVGRRAAAARLDRRGHAGSSRSGSTGSTATWRWRTPRRCARPASPIGRPTSPAARSCATARGSRPGC